MIEIPNWDERFEISQSRKTPHRISWTPLPHAFASVLRMQPPAVAAAMLQIVILAAGMPKRGVLHDGGRDLTLDDISHCVGADKSVVAAATIALGAAGPTSEREIKTDRKKEREGCPSPEDLRLEWNKTAQRHGLAKVHSLSAERRRILVAFGREAKTIEVAAGAFEAAAANYAAMPNGRGYGLFNLTLPANRQKWITAGAEAGPAPWSPGKKEPDAERS